MKTVKLSQKWQDEVNKMPERGMGSTTVNIKLKDGVLKGGGNWVRHLMVINGEDMVITNKTPQFSESDIEEMYFSL